MTVNYALTAYPASSAARERLSTALAADPVYVSLAELRRTPVLEAVSRLRSLKGGRLVIQLEDENGRAALPLLKAVAALSNARVIEVRGDDMRAERVSRWTLRLGLVQLGWASVAAMVAAMACSLGLSRLLRASRIEPAAPGDGKVIHLNANLWFGVKAGGSIGHVAGVVNALRDRGCAVAHASAGGRTTIRPDVPHVDLPAPKVFGLPYELNYYAFHRTIVRQLGRLTRPRFIYQRMSIGNYSGVVLSRQWRVPLVLEYNGSEVWVAKNWGLPMRYHRLAERAEAACLRHAHVVVTVSDVLRDELIAKGVEPDRIVSYPNCIDPAVFDPARFSTADIAGTRQRLGIRRDAVVATFVGTFGQWHGADVLAKAIRRMVDDDSRWLEEANVHFLLVGDGVKMAAVREILGDVCRRFVTLTGLVGQADAPSYLAASDVLLSPHVGNADGTRFFGSPTKLFEYMAMGKAIVASDLDQIGEVLRTSVRASGLPGSEPSIDEPRLAVLFPPGDVPALIDGIRFVVSQPRWRHVLGLNARTEALAKYTWMHHVDAIMAAVSSVATRRSLP